MNAIFRFLRDKSSILLFVFLEIICVTFIVKYSYYHSSYFFSNTNFVTGKIHEFNSELKYYLNLKDKNNDLFVENIELRKQLKNNYMTQTKQIFVSNDSVFKRKFEYIPAEVITNSISKSNNYLTINIGKSSGIKTDMWVFNPEGVVGKVIKVSENYSLVESLLNSNLTLIPKIKELNYAKGQIAWDGKDPNFTKFLNISKYEKIQKGQTLVTNPFSKTLPENIPIGTIVEVKQTADNFLDIKVKLAVDYTRVTRCYVALNLHKYELNQLETFTEE